MKVTFKLGLSEETFDGLQERATTLMREELAIADLPSEGVVPDLEDVLFYVPFDSTIGRWRAQATYTVEV